MKITKYGHSAFVIEDGVAKLLLDPGSFSSGFENVTGLTGILYTHVHGDHYNEGKLAPVLAGNPGVPILADEDTAAELKEAGHTALVAHDGDELELGGAKIKVIGHDHAIIHASMPRAKNVGYLLNGRLFYPGDALTVPPTPIEILLAPVAAPWMRVSEALDYLVAVKPRIALPAHEMATTLVEMYYGLMANFAKEQGTDWRPLKTGESVEL